jgi:hypothetical protein
MKKRTGNSINDMGAYPSLEKIFSKHKNSEQNFSTYISTLYMHVPSFMENRYFYVLCKKTKKMSHAILILAPNFVFLHTTQKISFSRETTL